MKKRETDLIDQNEKTKILKKEKMIELNDLPKVLIIYLSSFFDLKSLLNFSSTNQKYNKIFLQFRKGCLYINQIGFLSVFFVDEKEKKQNLKRILESKETVNLVDQIGAKIIHYACKSASVSLEMIQYFEEKNCDLNLQDYLKNNPLHYLSRNQFATLDVIKYLIEKGNNLNSRNNISETCLHCLCQNETISFEKLKFFVESKSDLNVKDDYKCTPLHLLCANKLVKYEMIKLLIENKASIHSLNKFGDDPLFYVKIKI